MNQLLLIVVLGLFSSLASAVTLDAAKGKTEFLAIGRPAAIKINGTGAGPTGDLTLAKAGADRLLNGEARVNLDSLDTGIGMRDRHMKEKYLETGKFGTAVLSFKDAKLPATLIATGGEAKVPARLNLHGIEKDVEVTLTLTKSAGKLATASAFRLKLSDFGIEIPRFSGITVADEVEVKTQTDIAESAIQN